MARGRAKPYHETMEPLGSSTLSEGRSGKHARQGHDTSSFDFLAQLRPIMALFDFFRRKPQTPPPHKSEEADLDTPRCHHYTLAHQALRSIALEEPLAFLGILASPDAQRFLADLMQSVSEHCKAHEPQPDFSVQELVVHRMRLGRYPCAVIEMPPPRAITEAFFVAAVLLADPSEGMPPQEVTLRYFTLEKGMTLEGPPRTVLCEWTAEGSHVNYGTGPEPRLEAFAEAVERMLARSQ